MCECTRFMTEYGPELSLCVMCTDQYESIIKRDSGEVEDLRHQIVRLEAENTKLRTKLMAIRTAVGGAASGSSRDADAVWEIVADLEERR